MHQALEAKNGLHRSSIRRGKSGFKAILSQCRDRKDWYPTQREATIALKQKGPKRAIGPPSRDRTKNRASQNTRAWEKSNENRSWRFDFRSPVCFVLQCKPFDERSGQKRDESGGRMKKWRLAEAKKLSLDLSNRRSDALRGDPSASPQDTSLSGRNCGAAFGRPFGFPRQELAGHTPCQRVCRNGGQLRFPQ